MIPALLNYSLFCLEVVYTSIIITQIICATRTVEKAMLVKILCVTYNGSLRMIWVTFFKFANHIEIQQSCTNIKLFHKLMHHVSSLLAFSCECCVIVELYFNLFTNMASYFYNKIHKQLIKGSYCIQRSAKKYAKLAKQDPGRARQSR